jgi:hypothetical protein
MRRARRLCGLVVVAALGCGCALVGPAVSGAGPPASASDPKLTVENVRAQIDRGCVDNVEDLVRQLAEDQKITFRAAAESVTGIPLSLG